MTTWPHPLCGTMWDNSWPTLLHCTTLTLSSRMFFIFSSSPSFFSRWSKYSCSLSHSSYGTVSDYTQTIFLSSQIQAPHLLDYPVMWRLCIEDSLHLCSSHFGPFQWPLLALNIWRKNRNITHIVQHSYFNFELPTQLSILQVTESQVRTLEGG